jgi:pre-mRNA-processing factor 40
MEWTEVASGARVYYFNTVTKQSVWDKPDVLKTPAEKAIDATSWKEYASNGKKYYVHNETKQVSPVGLAVRSLIDGADDVGPTRRSQGRLGSHQECSTPVRWLQSPGIPAYSGCRTPMAIAAPPPQNVSAAPGGGALILGGTGMGYVPPMPGELAKEPSLWFNNPEEAKRAFTDVLRQAGVRENWTWEQTMRHIITAPMYRALPTNEERRAAFEQYVGDLRKRDVERRQQAMERIRPAWREGLGRASESSGGNMKSWWSWERARVLLEQRYDDMWDMARDDAERKTLWSEYVGELRRKEKAREEELRAKNLAKLKKLFLVNDIGTEQTWSQVRRTIERTKEWQEDLDLQQLDPTDFLICYEDHFKQLEAQANEVKVKQKEEKRRRVRKNREGFVAMLQELKAAGKIVHNTNWATVYPLMEHDERYQNILGNAGSTPLELFWDVVDEMDQHVEEQCRVIEGVLAEKFKTVSIDTTWEQFAAMLESDGIPQTRVKDIDETGRRNVHGMVRRLSSATVNRLERSDSYTIATFAWLAKRSADRKRSCAIRSRTCATPSERSSPT